SEHPNRKLKSAIGIVHQANGLVKKAPRKLNSPLCIMMNVGGSLRLQGCGVGILFPGGFAFSATNQTLNRHSRIQDQAENVLYDEPPEVRAVDFFTYCLESVTMVLPECIWLRLNHGLRQHVVIAEPGFLLYQGGFGLLQKC